MIDERNLLNSIKILLKKLYYKIYWVPVDYINRKRDLKGKRKIENDIPIIKKSYINIKEIDLSSLKEDVIEYLAKMYLSHRFNVLGSGWVKVGFNYKALGIEGSVYSGNFIKKEKVVNYEPIDWHKDFKSGYRWYEKLWYKDIKYGDKRGADIKVPWELARLQHLPQLAIFSIKSEEILSKSLIEFKNQLLDFIENNPIRYGINWACSMEVAIRAVNMLIAYDIFVQIDKGGILDEDFKKKFSNFIFEQGRHIYENLEIEGVKNNHYLANLIGLFFISAYIDNLKEVRQWLCFSIQEIFKEFKRQFYQDGGNFESSTMYHRLSTEIMIYAIALILGLDDDKVEIIAQELKDRKKVIAIENNRILINQEIVDRLYKACRLIKDLRKPDGNLPQIGDNDSGRLIKLYPIGAFMTNEEAEKKYLNLQGYQKLISDYADETLYFDENDLECDSILGAISGIFEDLNDFNKFYKSFIKAISKKRLLTPLNRSYEPIRTKRISEEGLNVVKTIEYKYSNLGGDIEFLCYPVSGYYLFKNESLYLLIAATPIGQEGKGGHTHNDKLSYELWLDGNDVVIDPGSYLYTAIPERRNEFRSTFAHSVPLVDGVEQNDFIKGKLFKLRANSKYFLVAHNENFLEFYLKYKDVKILRNFQVFKDRIIITDKCNKEFYYSKFKYYSNGYGKIIKREQ